MEMKWLLVAGLLAAVARFGNAGALRCSPASLHPTCLEENGEVSQEAVSPEKETEYSEEECLPGSEWESNCHSCLCSSRGVALCSKLSKCEQEGELKPLRCKPGTTFKRDCNTCICPEDGVSLCTEIGCVHNLLISQNITKNGMEELDHLEMVPDNQHNRVKRTVCKPGQEFQSECNICHCATDGLSYRCTQNECMEGKEEEGRVDKEVEVFMESEGVDHIERHSVCRALATFYIGCNTCHCNYDGTDYTCTNKPCPLPDDVELFHELRASPVLKSAAAQPKNKTVVCVANRMFIKDCNTCWCNEDGTGFFCTRKVCVQDLPDDAADEEKPEELRVIQRECRPDEVFEVDCNMCRCNPDGKSFSCTRRACLAETPVENDRVVFEEQKPLSRMVRGVSSQQEPPKMCQPGQEFRLDCNKCLCDNEGKEYSCTRIDCRVNNGNSARRKREVAQQAVTQCEPGAVFDQGCNVCRCADDGHHANCTLKRCSLKPDAKEDNNMPAADTGFRCNPGEQFKRGCSDCTCSADGKSDFCTLRVCDKDLIPRL